MTMIFAFRILFLLILVLFITICAGFDNPYDVLGVSRTATLPEIKSAYKNLAKEWHPDKNKDPNASEKFVMINKAYQLLSNPARREEYDRYGTTEDKPNFRKTPDYSQFHRFKPFESFSGGRFRFSFGSDAGNAYHEYTISSTAYYNNVVTGSATKPYLVLFYSGFCIPCMQVEPLWNRIAEEFKPIGIGIACIHAELESKLASKIGASSVPYLIGVIDGRVRHYREERFNLKKAIEFTKNIFPSKTIRKLNSEKDLSAFLTGWNLDNKIRIMICSRLESIRLRFYTTAYKFKERAVFSYVQIGKVETEPIANRFGINKLHSETLLIFHEDSNSPVATLTMGELSYQAMHDVIEDNKYLLLPRLSSQKIFNSLCPPVPTKSKKHLCVVLITQNSPLDNEHREAMRDYLHSSSYTSKRVQFAYMFEEKQTEFMSSIANGKKPEDNSSAHQVVIIWRRDTSNINYEWLKDGWMVEPDRFNSSKKNLEAKIKQLLKTTDALPFNAVIKELKDEHELNIISKIANKVIHFVDSVQDRVSKEQVLSIVSIVLTTGIILLVGFGLSYLMKIEEESSGKSYKSKKSFCSTKSSQSESSLKIHELRAETYFGLLRLLKPGFRTIILLVDNESNNVLLPKFFKAVFPYRKNKSLMFATLNIDRNLDWFRGLLIQTLSSPRDLNINPKNCIGTVLSVNGQRKYFCMYHPKHPEQPRSIGSIGSTGGEFMGFETETESDSSDIESAKHETKLIKDTESIDSLLFEENLLDKLENWLDRLFEGSTHRYHFQIWPTLKH